MVFSKTQEYVSAKLAKITDEHLAFSGQHPSDIAEHFRTGIHVESGMINHCWMNSDNSPFDLPDEIVKLFGHLHFSGTKIHTKPKNNLNVILVPPSLWALNGKWNTKGKSNFDSIRKLVEFINDKYRPAMNAISSGAMMGKMLSKDAYVLSLGSKPGITPNEWTGTNEPILLGNQTFNNNNVRMLPFPLRGEYVDEPYTVEGIIRTINIAGRGREDQYRWIFTTPTGQETPEHLRKELRLGVNTIDGPTTFYEYLKSVFTESQRNPKEVCYFEQNQQLVAMQNTIIERDGTNDMDVFTGLNLNFLEKVESNREMMDVMRSKISDLENGDFHAQMIVFEEIVQSVRDVGGRFLVLQESVETEDMEEQGDVAVTYKDAGDHYIAYYYLPLLCEYLLGISIKSGSRTNVGTHQQQPETQQPTNLDESEQQPPTQDEDEARIDLYHFAAVGLNWLDDGDVEETKEALEKCCGVSKE